MRGTIFKDKSEYEKMIQMIRSGMKYTDIAKHFNCDHTSIVYHAHKLGIKRLPERKNPQRRYYPQDKKHSQVQDYILRERINPGKKNYRAYIKFEEQRIGRRISV